VNGAFCLRYRADDLENSHAIFRGDFSLTASFVLQAASGAQATGRTSLDYKLDINVKEGVVQEMGLLVIPY
jgi:hypothetical protein